MAWLDRLVNKFPVSTGPVSSKAELQTQSHTWLLTQMLEIQALVFMIARHSQLLTH